MATTDMDDFLTLARARWSVRSFSSRPIEKEPVCLLPIGYAAPNARPYAPWHDTFRPLSETVEII